MITYQDVQAARERIAPYIVRTPLLRVPALDEALGCQVYLKHEGFQPMGAFKLRGAYNKIRSLTPEEAARGVIACSAGNHAQGIALSLEFKLGSEVLRTVVVRDWSELGILGAVIALRGALTFLIHWEIKNEETKMSE